MENVAQEYDYFGPWLLQVKSAHDIPHQYFEYQEAILDAEYCFKIPINEDRRKLHAGMLLYNKLITINDENIVQFSVVNDQIVTTELSFIDVQYIVHQGDLLNCEISLQTHEKCLSFQYNLVSMDLAAEIMSLLRTKVNTTKNAADRPEFILQKYSELQIYSYFCITEHEDKPLEILDYQPCLDLGLLASNKLFQSLTKYRLLDTMFMTNGLELVIANRGKYLVQENDTNYKFGHTFIPLSKITGMTVESDEMFKAVKKINILQGEQQVQIAVNKDFTIDKLESLLPTN